MISDAFASPLFPLEELSPETYVKLPKVPHAESKSVKMYIILAEPHIFLEGFTKDEVQSRPPAILRGCLFVRVSNPVKIKEINLKLTGTARTEWPEGIPPKKVEHLESKGIINHTWPFFNCLNNYPVLPTKRNNADLYIPKSDADVSSFSLDGSLTPVSSNNNNNNNNHGSELRPILSPVSILKSFRNNASSTANSITGTLSPSMSSNDLVSTMSGGTESSKHFPAGDYIYSFELPIQSSLPESVSVTFGSIQYNLEAHLERSGAFKTSLFAKRPLSIVRAPFENSSEENEPIIIDRDWENRLQYDIVIYSKQIILNSYLPISFRMIPLEKIKVHRLRVYMTEHLEYYCHNKKVHRTEPSKKIMLLEHKPVAPCDNLLAMGEDEIGGVELDFQVFIPEYYNEKYHLHPDTTSEDIQAHHWIKICIRISRSEPTPEDPDKRKQYELSIDSPMHLLSSLCVHANTLLPSYEEQLRIDTIANAQAETESASARTLTPQQATDHTANNLIGRQSMDKMMKPRNDTILESNMFKPNSNVPIEMLSPQAKPFSPIASPQLNAIHPELRETPTMRSLDLSPVTSATTYTISRSRSSTKVVPSMRSRTLSPMQRSTNSLSSMRPALGVRTPSQSSVNEPPPPPFAVHPPTYNEAMRSSQPTSSSTTNSTTATPSRPHRKTNASTLSTESNNSGQSHNSSGSGLSFSAHADGPAVSPALAPVPAPAPAPAPTPLIPPPMEYTMSRTSNASLSSMHSSSHSNSHSTLATNLTGKGSGAQPSTRISLNLGSSMNNSMVNLGSAAGIDSLMGSLASLSEHAGANANAGTDTGDTTSSPPSGMASQYDTKSSPKKHSLAIPNGDLTLITRGRGSERTNANLPHSRDQSPSYDLAENTNLKFKITPIRSTSVSPFLRPQSSSRSESPIRSMSPVPIVAQDRNLNKLVSSSFTPGFSLDKPTQGHDLVTSPMIRVTDSNTTSNGTKSGMSPNTTSLLGTSDLDTILIPNDNINVEDDQDESAILSRPLFINYNNEESLLNSESSEDEETMHHNINSTTLESLNSLDLMLDGNMSSNTLNMGLGRGSLSVGRPGMALAKSAQLNYLGNNTSNSDILSTKFDDMGTDITSMLDSPDEGTPSWGKKLRNPKRGHGK